MNNISGVKEYLKYRNDLKLGDVYKERIENLKKFLHDYEYTVKTKSFKLRKEERKQAETEKQQAMGAIRTKYNDMIKEENDYYDKLEIGRAHV